MKQKYKLWVDDDVGLCLCYVTPRRLATNRGTNHSSQLNVAEDFSSNDAGVWLFPKRKGKGNGNEPSRNYQPYIAVIPLGNKNLFISVKPYKVKYNTHKF